MGDIGIQGEFSRLSAAFKLGIWTPLELQELDSAYSQVV